MRVHTPTRLNGGQVLTIASGLLLGLLFSTGMVSANEAPPSAVGPLLKLYQSNRLPPARQPAVVEMICDRGNAHDLRVVFDRLISSEGVAPALKTQILQGLHNAATTRKVKPTGDLTGLIPLLEDKDPATRELAVQLAATWKVVEVTPTLEKIAFDPHASSTLQGIAIQGLVSLQGTKAEPALIKLAQASPSIAARMQAVAALASVNLPSAAKEGAAVLVAATPQDDPAALLNAFFDRKEGSELLAKAIEANPPAVDQAKRALRFMYSIGRNDALLSGVLSKAAGVAADPPPPTPEEVAKLVVEVEQKGDAARGEKIFRRADLSCLRCHSLNRAGGQVGPDLSAVGGSSPMDYMVNSVLNPNLAVKEQYVTRIFETVDGKVLTGMVIDRDDSRVRIRDSQGQTLVIPTADIDYEAEGRSIMPSGLTKFLTHDELLDLIRFVAELGKPGPYAPPAKIHLQRWQQLAKPPQELTTDVPHLEHLRQFVFGAADNAWVPVYAQFSGVIPLDELRKEGQPTVAILRGEIQVHEPGPLEISVTSSETCQVWIDSESLTVGQPVKWEATPGRHSITVRVEISERPQPELKVEFQRPADSAVQFEVIGGV